METQVNTQVKPKFYTKRQPTEAQKEAMRAKRDELRAISKTIKILVKEGKYDTGLIEYYAENGHKNLKTIHQWNGLNMIVKKGEHALLLWGTPKKTGKKDEAKTPDQEEKEMEFYPLCFVLSDIQVQPMAAK